MPFFCICRRTIVCLITYRKFFKLIFSDISNYYGFDDNVFRSSAYIADEKLILKSSAEDSPLIRLLHTSPDKYEASEYFFNTNCNNMLDFLRVYNLNDCHLLCESIDAYGTGFLNEYNVNVHSFMSLPGVAEHIAYKFYDENACPIYSFGPQFKKYNEEIRA
jgi:hypothetical protein